MEKSASVGMNLRRGQIRLRTIGKAHSPLHILLWQAREAQRSLLAAASAQRTLFNDFAAWASTENRALSDVAANVTELSSVYVTTLTNLSRSYKAFQKDMSLVLEGERRCDNSQKVLQEAEGKRLKLRRQVVKAQNRVQLHGENLRRSGDFTALQTQLAEAERTAERSHLLACEAGREQESVKLVLVRSALSKLSEAHITHAHYTRTIFEASHEIASQVPEPPPPNDPLSTVRYTGYETTKGIVQRVKSQILHEVTPSSTSSANSTRRPTFSSTPITSPISRSGGGGGGSESRIEWTPEPSAPSRDNLSLSSDLPPPYHSHSGTTSMFLSHCCHNSTSPEDGAPPTSAPSTSSSRRSNDGRRRSCPGRATVSPLPNVTRNNSEHRYVNTSYGPGEDQRY